MIPGPSVGFTIAYAIRHGTGRTVSTIAGQLTANALQLLLVSIGLNRLLEASTELFAIMKWAGVAYLLYLGVRQWRARRTDEMVEEQEGNSTRTVWCDVRRGFLVCATNPKALLYFAALLPQFLSSEGEQSVQLAILGATNLAIGGLVMASYALFADRVSGWLERARSVRTQERVSGGLMIAAAAYLAIGRRS
jgi:homoserine/homoserine lactone efflux protein